MAKSAFKRGLSPETLQKVKEFLKTEIGQYINNDSNFQICIRDEYINVYCSGCSILKYTPRADKYEIHCKYIGESRPKPYLELERKGSDLVINNFSLLDLVKKPGTYIGRYVCGEKEYLAQYLKSGQAPAVIDLEIAYTCKNNGAQKRDFVAKRIDLAVFEAGNKLQLIEVKTDSDSRLRSVTDGDQKILVQMRSYREFIKVEAENILASYKTVAKNILDLGLMHKMGASTTFTAENLSGFISNGSLNPDPGLLVVDTGKNKYGRNRVDHWERLLIQFEKLGFQPPQTWKP